MEVITSKSNSKIMDAKKLQDKKYRDKLGLFLVETKKVVLEALKHNLMPTCFFIRENQNCDFFSNNVPIYHVSESVFSQISSMVTPDGYIGIFKKPIFEKKYFGGNFLILDGLQNPDNMGAIMRTALATGFEQIFTINCVDTLSPKVLRASMGNQFGLKIVEISKDDIKQMFSNANLFTASMEGKNIFEIDIPNKNIGIIIGNEGNGVGDEIKKLVSNIISIPMKNNVESLNASVSASIIMYHMTNLKV